MVPKTMCYDLSLDPESSVRRREEEHDRDASCQFVLFITFRAFGVFETRPAIAVASPTLDSCRPWPLRDNRVGVVLSRRLRRHYFLRAGVGVDSWYGQYDFGGSGLARRFLVVLGFRFKYMSRGEDGRRQKAVGHEQGGAAVGRVGGGMWLLLLFPFRRLGTNILLIAVIIMIVVVAGR
jgi:hypothetical protein